MSKSFEENEKVELNDYGLTWISNTEIPFNAEGNIKIVQIIPTSKETKYVIQDHEENQLLVDRHLIKHKN
jgi:hypothetical protein